MSENVLKIKKCIENGASSERVGAASEAAVGVGALQWNQPLEDPRGECPRQRERQEWRALHTWPTRCLLHMWKRD